MQGEKLNGQGLLNSNLTQIRIAMQLGRELIATLTYLTMSKSSNCHVPRCVGDHNEPKEWPESVIPEGGHQHCEHATGSKDVGPLPLVQVIVDQKDVAAASNVTQSYQTLAFLG